MSSDVEHDVDAVGLGALRHSIEQGNPSLVWCEQCRRAVGVDRYGLRCDHDRDASPPLRSSLFDGVFDEPTRRYRLREWLVDRLRAWL